MIYGRIRAALLAAAVISFAACGGSNTQPAQPEPAPAPAPAADTTAPAADTAAGDTAATPADTTAPAGDTAAPAAGDKITEADMEKAVTMFEALAAAAHGHVGDCDAQAADMQKVMDDHKDFIARMNAMQGKDPEAEKLFQEKYQDRIGKVMMGMMQDLQACQDNANVKKVFESLK